MRIVAYFATNPDQTELVGPTSMTPIDPYGLQIVLRSPLALRGHYS